MFWYEKFTYNKRIASIMTGQGLPHLFIFWNFPEVLQNSDTCSNSSKLSSVFIHINLFPTDAMKWSDFFFFSNTWSYKIAKNISGTDLYRIISEPHRVSYNGIRLVPGQDVHFFYTRSHFSALQNCAVLFSTNFQFIFIFKKCTKQFSHWIV